MRISSSNVELASEQLSYNNSSVYEYLHKWNKKSDTIVERHAENDSLTKESTLKKDLVDLSDQARLLVTQAAAPAVRNASAKESGDDSESLFGDDIESLKMQIVRDMVEMFTGKKMKVFEAQDLQKIRNDMEQLDTSQFASHGNAVSAGQQLEGWGVDYYRREVQQSVEGFSFTAQGAVTTADGKSINFSAALEMSREQYTEITTSIKDGDALIDPLVINFSGAGTELSDAKFEFDLDADGTAEMINATSSGSGLLAYDKNGNGVIDDGSELFGPSSGNGFLELASFDNDKNGWIDENDAVFSQLKVWEKGSDGSDTLSGLLEKDVGALYTGSAGTSYSLKNNNELTGQIRESGIWLRESSGSVGTLQEIDLVA